MEKDRDALFSLLKDWAQSAGADGLASKVLLFGSLFQKEGRFFKPKSSDIDLVVVLPSDALLAVERAGILESLRVHVEKLENNALRLLGRKNASKSIVSIVAATEFELERGVHKDKRNFYANNEFVDVVSREQMEMPPKSSWPPALEDAFEVFQSVQKMRNMFLRIAANGEKEMQPFCDPLTDIPKDLARSAAIVSWYRDSPSIRKNDDRYSTGLGASHIRNLIHESRGLERVRIIDEWFFHYRSLDHAIPAEDVMIMWELLFDDARSLMDAKTGAAADMSARMAMPESSVTSDEPELVRDDESMQVMELGGVQAEIKGVYRENNFDPCDGRRDAEVLSRKLGKNGTWDIAEYQKMLKIVRLTLEGLSRIFDMPKHVYRLAIDCGWNPHSAVRVGMAEMQIRGATLWLDAGKFKEIDGYQFENIERALEAIESFLELDVMRLHLGPPGWSIAPSALGDRNVCIAVGLKGTDGTCRYELYAEDGGLLGVLNVGTHRVSAPEVFCSGGDILIVARQPRFRAVWKLSTGSLLSLARPPESLRAGHKVVTSSKDHKQILFGRSEREVTRLDGCGEHLVFLAPQGDSLIGLGFGPADSYMVVLLTKMDDNSASWTEIRMVVDSVEISCVRPADFLLLPQSSHAGLKEWRFGPDCPIVFDSGRAIACVVATDLAGLGHLCLLDLLNGRPLLPGIAVGDKVEEPVIVSTDNGWIVACTLMRRDGPQLVVFEVHENAAPKLLLRHVGQGKAWNIAGVSAANGVRVYFIVKLEEGENELWCWRVGPGGPKRVRRLGKGYVYGLAAATR